MAAPAELAWVDADGGYAVALDHGQIVANPALSVPDLVEHVASKLGLFALAWQRVQSGDMRAFV